MRTLPRSGQALRRRFLTRPSSIRPRTMNGPDAPPPPLLGGLPDDTTRFTAVPVFTLLPAAGVCEITLPDATLLLDCCVTVPTASPAPVIAVLAADCD